MLVTQIVKDYLKDVRDLANEKIMLAADLFSICPRLLQERVNLKAKESLDARKTAIYDEEYYKEDEKGSEMDDPLIEAKVKKLVADREPELVDYAESHSRHSAYWLWKTDYHPHYGTRRKLQSKANGDSIQCQELNRVIENDDKRISYRL